MERYTEDALMSDMILCLRELDNREQPNTCRVLAKLATDYTKNMADAQATVEAVQAQLREGEAAYHKVGEYNDHLKQQVEALQRERDALKTEVYDQKKLAEKYWKEAREADNKRVEYETALDAEREKVKKLEEKLRVNQRAVYAEGKVRELLRDRDNLEFQLSQLQALVRALPLPKQPVPTEQLVQAMRGLFDYRIEMEATLDATTPAKGGDGE